MRLIAFEDAGQTGLGVRIGGEVVDLSRLGSDVPGEMPALLAQGPGFLVDLAERAERAGSEVRRPLEGLALLPPVPRPGKTICIGLNYALHAKEGGNPIPDYPALFLRGPTSLTAHGRPMIRPRASTKLDYEAELAFVIGRRARHVSEADALAHVAGYACFNEGSVRDYQRKSTSGRSARISTRPALSGPSWSRPTSFPPARTGCASAPA